VEWLIPLKYETWQAQTFHIPNGELQIPNDRCRRATSHGVKKQAEHTLPSLAHAPRAVGLHLPALAPRQYPRIYCSPYPGSGKSSPRSRLDRPAQKSIAVPAEINIIEARNLTGRKVPLGPTATGIERPAVAVWPLRSPAQGLKWAGYRAIGKMLHLVGQWRTRSAAEVCRVVIFPQHTNGAGPLFPCPSAGARLDS
jgi:hypothetical protein